MTDRERVEALAQRREKERREAERAEQQRKQEEAARHRDEIQDDEKKTKELLTYFNAEFGGGWRMQNGGDAIISVEGPYRRSGRQDDEIRYVTVSVDVWPGAHPYRLPLVQARHRKGKYELLYGDKTEAFGDLAAFKERLITVLGECDQSRVNEEVEWVRRHYGR